MLFPVEHRLAPHSKPRFEEPRGCAMPEVSMSKKEFDRLATDRVIAKTSATALLL